MSVNILAIESSCDETSAAVISDGKVLSNTVLSQEVHSLYGGVVPELASRSHQKHLITIVEQALRNAGISRDRIHAVGFTLGPGLLGSLLVGVSFAKGYALARNIPLISVNHMKAHILAHFIDDPRPSCPFLCLTVSGGHTQIVLVKSVNEMEVIGSTRDDAVGEAFDKTAKMLGLTYPGGHLIDKYAKEGNPDMFVFPQADIPGLDFSFSGIKTAVLYFLKGKLSKDPDFIIKNFNDLCASIQKNLIDMLFDKLLMAADETGIMEIAIAGGVAANSLLRKRLVELSETRNWNTYIPDFEYCTDNAGMIGMAAYFKYKNNDFAGLDVSPDARLSF